jgi:antitoxin (DNA-binding transcriptional repressor) of toxin-antitoxin stability system
VLNRVAQGEDIEIVRNGLAIAVITPPPIRLLSAARFAELIATAPAPDADLAADLRRIRASVGPPQDAWPS